MYIIINSGLNPLWWITFTWPFVWWYNRKFKLTRTNHLSFTICSRYTMTVIHAFTSNCFKKEKRKMWCKNSHYNTNLFNIYNERKKRTKIKEFIYENIKFKILIINFWVFVLLLFYGFYISDYFLDIWNKRKKKTERNEIFHFWINFEENVNLFFFPKFKSFSFHKI